MEVTVSLKNPPSGATEWQLALHDWNKTHIESKFYIPITDPAVFEVPPGTIFPLRVDMLIYHNGIIDYRMQSVGTEFPFPPEWYVEAFIPDYGNYYYNVTAEQFEEIAEVPYLPCEIAIDAPDNAIEGETVNVAAIIRNVSAYSYSYKTEIYAEATLLLSTDNIITSGSARGYITSFIMPARDVTILVWVERWAFDHWIYDNAASKVVSLEAVPEYKGTISKKELEYDETRGIIPVY